MIHLLLGVCLYGCFLFDLVYMVLMNEITFEK